MRTTEQFEALIARVCPLERLYAYKELRALRPVLFMETGDFSSHDFYAGEVDIRPRCACNCYSKQRITPGTTDRSARCTTRASPPHSTVLHHLFARGPPELQLPYSDVVQPGLHVTNHTAAMTYSHWMDGVAQRATSKADPLVGADGVLARGV